VTHGDFLVYSVLTDSNVARSSGDTADLKDIKKRKKRPVSVKISRNRTRVNLQVKLKLFRDESLMINYQSRVRALTFRALGRKKGQPLTNEFIVPPEVLARFKQSNGTKSKPRSPKKGRLRVDIIQGFPGNSLWNIAASERFASFYRKETGCEEDEASEAKGMFLVHLRALQIAYRKWKSMTSPSSAVRKEARRKITVNARKKRKLDVWLFFLQQRVIVYQWLANSSQVPSIQTFCSYRWPNPRTVCTF
jgi:hypothetical protein